MNVIEPCDLACVSYCSRGLLDSVDIVNATFNSCSMAAFCASESRSTVRIQKNESELYGERQLALPRNVILNLARKSLLATHRVA